MAAPMEDFKPKGFWQRPEGKTGTLFGIALLGAAGYAAYFLLPPLAFILANTLYTIALLAAIAGLVYILVDPKFRNLLWYMYKSVMRSITSLFVQIDPIGIIESYLDSLRDNLKKMGAQINNLRGQMRKLKTDIENNEKMMQQNITLAGRAKDKGMDNVMVLKARKAGRLQESNIRLQDLYKKMEVLYQVLCKMYENSEVLLEDIQDEVSVRKREREAMLASHSAMQSAMNIIKGDPDRRQMFDQAMEAIADDVGKKVGEMERFMEISSGFMNSIDLQNGVFEESGLEMLDKWEKEGASLLLGKDKDNIINQINKSTSATTINLDQPVGGKHNTSGKTQYSDLFDF